MPKPLSVATKKVLHRLIRMAGSLELPRLPRWGENAGSLLRNAVALARAGAPARLAQLGPDAPTLSLVVPVYNTPPAYLDALLASFNAQAYPNRELVLSDDGSTRSATCAWLRRHAGAAKVRVLVGSPNRGIAGATNAGIAAASGTWIGLLDHDDALAPHALDLVAEALAQNPECLFLYTDEAVADARLRPKAYFLKPAFDPVLLSGVNYINHFSFYRRDRLLALGGLREGFQGSQDYDLVLRYTRDLARSQVRHLPYPAYLWRRDGASYSATFLETATRHARAALAQHYGSAETPAPVGAALISTLHRVELPPPGGRWPRVSVVIPSFERIDLIGQVLEGLTRRTDYPDMEIIVIDNGSTSPDVLALYQRLAASHPEFHAHVAPEAFNFSRSVNRGIAQSKGELILLLNNDIEVLEPGWLKEMVSCFSYPDVGIVGARLLYPDRSIQHVGVIAGFGGLAGHWYHGQKPDFPGPMGRLQLRQSLTVVTGACLLVSRACLDVVGLLDEERFAIAYNDVDLCLRAHHKGFRIVLTPNATLVHHESATRGSDMAPDKIDRFRREQASLAERHGTATFEDPAHNPWYTRDRSAPTIRQLTLLPRAR